MRAVESNACKAGPEGYLRPRENRNVQPTRRCEQWLGKAAVFDSVRGYRFGGRPCLVHEGKDLVNRTVETELLLSRAKTGLCSTLQLSASRGPTGPTASPSLMARDHSARLRLPSPSPATADQSFSCHRSFAQRALLSPLESL